MQIRYTATSDLNLVGETDTYYDHGGADGYFRTGSFMDRALPFVLSFSFKINDLSLYPRLIRIGSIGRIYLTTSGEVRLWRDGDATGTTHATLIATEGVESTLTLVWDGAGAYTFTLDTGQASGTASEVGATSSWLQIGTDDDTYLVDGYIRDIAVSVNGVNVAAYAATEGSGTVFNDTISGHTATLAGTGSPEQTGWVTTYPPHAAGNSYTSTVKLIEYDRSRKFIGKRATSLSGETRTVEDRHDTVVSCVTTPVTGLDLRNLREFLSSTINGSRFEFDDGSGFVDAVLVQNSYVEARAIRRGDGGDGDYMTFAWSHREV